MLLFAFSSFLLASVLTLDVNATPLASPPSGRVIPINRSFRRHKPVHTAHSSTLPLFDPEPFTRECQGLKRKYFNVSNNLPISSGVDGLDIVTVDDAEAPFIPPVVIAPNSLPLKDYIYENLDLLYYGLADLGTPGQSFSIDIDSGSADLWIPVNCSECEGKQFEDTKSSTCKNSHRDFSVSYGSGEVSGTLMQDVVSMAGFEIRDQFFGAVCEVSDDFRGLPNDGLLGMAFSTIAQSGEPTFFENLMENNMLPAPMFSVHLARNQESGSEVCFGCMDRMKTLGPVKWVPVCSKTYWSVSMDAVGVNTTALVDKKMVGIIDTGTTLVYMPDVVVSEFYSMISGSKPAPEYGPEFFTYPCSTTLDIQLSFGGNSFSMSSLDFNLGTTAPNSPDCVGGILSLGSDEGFPSNLAIIGDAFLKSCA
ncbi:aspartic peptidase domain-containing protein [Mycena galericulata]|nr:aspartic peptidase domain-containing protein [Mycena galericulata]